MTWYDSQEDLEYTVQETIVDRATTDSNVLLKALVETFKRLPEEDAITLIDERNIHFILPTVNMAYDLPDQIKKPWLILLRSDCIELPKEEFIYVITHELAHCFLEHIFIGSSEQEIEADKQVIKWGFEKELRATSWNYLYGSSDPYHGFKDLEEMYEKRSQDRNSRPKRNVPDSLPVSKLSGRK